MDAAVYLRVSTDRCRWCRRREHRPDGKCRRFEREQHEQNQRPDCERLCAARGWRPVLYEERESGAKHRPQWEALLEAARKGEVRAVVFWALDRTGRTAVEVCHDLRELARWNVAIASVKDAWVDQPAGPFRDLMLSIVAWFAERERDRLIERTKAGQERARAEGKHVGRPGRLSVAAVARAMQLREQHVCTDGSVFRTPWSAVADMLEREGHGKHPVGSLSSAVKRASQSGGQK